MSKQGRNVRPLRRLAPFLKPYKKTVLLAAVALTTAAGATLTIPVAIRQLIDQGFANPNAGSIDGAFVLMGMLAMVLALATAGRFYLVSWLGERLVADLRSAVFNHVLNMSPVFFETTRTGEVLSRLTTDTTLIQSVIGSSASVAIRNLLLLTGGLVMLFITSPKLTALILLLIPLVVLPIVIFGRRVRTLSRASQDRIADSSATAGEVLNAMTTVQAFNQQAHERQRFADVVETSFDTARQRIRTRAILTALVILLVFGAIVFVLWLGAHAVLANEMSAGLLGQFLLYAVFTGGSAGALSESWGEVQRAAGATERLMELMDAQPVIQAPATPKLLAEPVQGAVQLRDVTFAYPSRPEQPALKAFSLTIEPGETVALVGPSGAGKSTVFQLLMRFYDPQSGEVMIDQTDVCQAEPQQVRSRLAIVPQEAVIFADSALENIRYGRLDASDDEVFAASRLAAAHEFLQAQPDGYDSFLGERGVRLSGGQKQRVAIARAMLRNAPIVLLDEATSALDAESEKLVHDALDQLTENRTTIVIAHRLSTVLAADRIVVMEQGQVVATGTHDELLAEGGLYARLARLQFQENSAA